MRVRGGAHTGVERINFFWRYSTGIYVYTNVIFRSLYSPTYTSPPTSTSPRKLSHRVDVQTHVVDCDRLPQLGHHLVHERLAQTLGQVLDVRA